MTKRDKQWVLRKAATTPPKQWAERLGIPEGVLDVLSRRNLSSLDEMNVFLSPLVEHLQAPENWPGMSEAADALVHVMVRDKAAGNNHAVLIWGDYDVDGITASALCVHVLGKHGIPVITHLPSRCDGYGLNIPSLEKLCTENRISALLTVDCGISDTEAVTRARELGLVVVVSDHHLPPEDLPNAHALCNPRLAESCPCAHLAGVGVAFFLMALVNSRLSEALGTPRADMREVLDLVALGTIADMVPLTGQNRILTKNGLLKIAEAARPGLGDLKEASGFFRHDALTAGKVGFQIAPRLNAAGRIGSAMDALNLLLARPGDPALKIAERLNTLNQQRRDEEERICREAMEQAKELMAADPSLTALVVYGANWHQGVIGIAASRLVEQWGRPVLVLCDDMAPAPDASTNDTDATAKDPMLKGSGRSIREFDLHAGLCVCAAVLEGFGGHSQAAGLRVRRSQLAALRSRFHETALAALGPTPITPTLRVDGELCFCDAADFTFLKALELLQPFGIGNPEPVFVSKALKVTQARAFGRDKDNMNLTVQELDSGISLQAKAWRQAGDMSGIRPGQLLRLAFAPGINTFNGVTSVELQIKGWTTNMDGQAFSSIDV